MRKEIKDKTEEVLKDKTEEVLKDLSKLGFKGKDLEAAYLIYASCMADFFGTNEQQKHFNNRIKNFSFES